MFCIENHDKKPTNIFPNYIHFSAIPQFISSSFHLLPSPFSFHPFPLNLGSLTYSNLSPLSFHSIHPLLAQEERKWGQGNKKEKAEVKSGSGGKGAFHANGEKVQCVMTEIRKWRYRKCAGEKTGHSAKQSQYEKSPSFLINIINRE